VVSEGWEPAQAGDVVAGQRVRVGGEGGVELTVSRVEPRFLDRPGMIAFIEDTPERWLKAPLPEGAAVEVRR
jgi:hypothetical protein